MNSGIYGAISGNMAMMKQLDVLANNLANVNTPGYKKDSITFEAVLTASVLQGTEGSADSPALATERYAIDFSAGVVKVTDNTFDIALDGDGFFAINTPQGKAYTRQGNFKLDANSRLVTADGYEVLGNGAPIVINGGSVSFDAKGKILVEGQETGTLDVVDFPKPYDLKKIGSALFMPNDANVTPQAARDTLVRQGHLEGSNVNPLEAMVRMIETTRSSETCQKMIQNYDQMTGRAVNELGKV
ncbi:MAG: flagellar basal-body rod protein FlgF [Deltaproteobacteria bacterium]|nr:flagellar basal-body rod protein FlgF [Deltaproteobacteria bacterium]TLN04811.1 MAG: flagellar basal-body rod protein FlgF [bacterium]